MTAVVYRVYLETNQDENDTEDYIFSVIASETGSEYFFGDKPSKGLDAERIERNVLRLYEKDEKPETIEEWAGMALYRVGGKVYKLAETFETAKEAIKAEKEFALEAEEMRKDMYESEEEDD
jgi:spore coat polysaccharide biosynthesis protein SpsF (cytidylyltransferase family)